MVAFDVDLSLRVDGEYGHVGNAAATAGVVVSLTGSSTAVVAVSASGLSPSSGRAPDFCKSMRLAALSLERAEARAADADL